MKRFLSLLTLLIVLLFLSACGKPPPACPTETGTSLYMTTPPDELPAPTPVPASTPAAVDINGKSLPVDRVIEGPLCNDTWSGTIYVTCNIQIYPWEENPTFLKDCNLDIAPGTVVYVAHHNDTAYYKGCSCHTGEIAEP